MVDALFPCVYHHNASGRLGDRGLALSGSRKVRTPQSTASDSTRGGQLSVRSEPAGSGPQKQTANSLREE